MKNEWIEKEKKQIKKYPQPQNKNNKNETLPGFNNEESAIVNYHMKLWI